MGFLDGISGQSGYFGQQVNDFFGTLKGGYSSVDEYKASNDQPLVVDSGDKEIDDYMNRIAGLPAETKDYLTEYFLNEKSRKNAFNDSMMASNTQYQRAVADLKKAGLNPFLAFDALRGSAPSSAAGSVSGGHNVSRVNNEKGLGVKAGAIIAALLAAFIGVIGKGVTSDS